MVLGIPRALLFYRYRYFWDKFFSLMGFKVIYSDLTTKDMVSLGKKYANSEDCLSYKIFMGHVHSLIGKCDYILVPRFESFGVNELVCSKFNGLYDLVKGAFPDVSLIDYNVDVLSDSLEFNELVRIGKSFSYSDKDIAKFYSFAKSYQNDMDLLLFNKQNEKLASDKCKVLIVSHPYNIHDNFIGLSVVKKLEDLGIDVLFSDYVLHDVGVENSKSFTKDCYWLFNKEIIGGIKYYENYIDGIVFLSTFPCGCDGLVNEIVMKNVNKPVLNLVIDEHQDMGGFDTRIESFIDIVRGVSI